MTNIMCPTCQTASLTSKVISLLPIGSMDGSTIYWDVDGTQKRTAQGAAYVLFLCSRKHVWYDLKPDDL